MKLAHSILYVTHITLTHPISTHSPSLYRKHLLHSESLMIYVSRQKHFSLSVPSPVHRSNSCLDRMSLCCLICR